MKPALSVVLFTVLAGAGLGSLAILALAGLAGAWIASPRVLMRTDVVAIVLLAAGLACSTLHLANPRNAWRSLARVRSSWLSREAACALLLMPIAALAVAATGLQWSSVVRSALSLACVVLSWATLFCTAMIYASLKPIRQWNTARVPLLFFALAHASGAIVVVAVLRGYGEASPMLTRVAIALLCLAALAKLEYDGFVASGERAVTMAQAIGVARGVRPPGTEGRPVPVRLFDTGHSRGTFLTREFGFSLACRGRSALRAISWTAGFALPVAWLALGLPDWRGGVVALAACMIGLVADRWLFFADARHTVRLYHGDAST